MSDIIKLLPDSVANQIAAGEVIQRPASAVKEMLENSIDAKASSIKLIIKDAGKTLIQIIDDGIGMSETDARMCFERHATSKISDAKDLFSINTLGFRGEALASIASIARVELKTRKEENQLGTEIIVEGSVVETQQPCQCPKGTSIAVKNLFYNTPARRNFLKSDNVERSNIFNEIVRVSLAHPDVAFSYHHNNQLIQQLEPGNLKQRIVSLFGNNYNHKLVPIEEKTHIVKISGYIVKPEFSKKKRGEQFLFVNNRYIRSPYLNHAIEQAYTDLITDGMHPAFFLFLSINPNMIDVNVHPTKTEVKFQDERFMYQLLLASAKKALAQNNITPTLDFERETAFDDIIIDKNKEVKPPQVIIDPDYNPFETSKEKPANIAGKHLSKHVSHEKWESIFPGEKNEIRKKPCQDNIINEPLMSEAPKHEDEITKSISARFIQVQNKYILCTVKSGFMIIDQKRAHERILFEKFISYKNQTKKLSQTLLYPEQIELNESDSGLLKEILGEVNALGFDITEFSRNTFVVNSIPADIPENENVTELIESLIESYKNNQSELKPDIQSNICRTLAKKLSIKQGVILSDSEMNAIVDALFACQIPNLTPSGKPTLSILSTEEIEGRF